jgi:hypothetical protein
MSTRKPCINVPTASYSGKEQSPLHFGISAEGYDLDTVMQGYDQMIWIVKIKNGKKVWVRQQSGACVQRLVHEEPVISPNPEMNPSGAEEIQEAAVSSSLEHNEKDKVDEKDIKKISKKKVPIMTADVQEKKLTDYNIYLSYKLHILKKENVEKKPNKDLLNMAIADWKDLKKNPGDFLKTMEAAHKFNTFK